MLEELIPGRGRACHGEQTPRGHGLSPPALGCREFGDHVILRGVAAFKGLIAGGNGRVSHRLLCREITGLIAPRAASSLPAAFAFILQFSRLLVALRGCTWLSQALRPLAAGRRGHAQRCRLLRRVPSRCSAAAPTAGPSRVSERLSERLRAARSHPPAAFLLFLETRAGVSFLGLRSCRWKEPARAGRGAACSCSMARGETGPVRYSRGKKNLGERPGWEAAGLRQLIARRRSAWARRFRNRCNSPARRLLGPRLRIALCRTSQFRPRGFHGFCQILPETSSAPVVQVDAYRCAQAVLLRGGPPRANGLSPFPVPFAGQAGQVAPSREVVTL